MTISNVITAETIKEAMEAQKKKLKSMSNLDLCDAYAEAADMLESAQQDLDEIEAELDEREINPL